MKLEALLQKLEVPREGDTVANRWINNDIRPIERGRRTWTFWSYHNLWVTININISTYLTGSSLIALGLTWWQALISIAVGAVLITTFVILNSTPGAFYHLGFPIANRYVWGMYGSQFVILNRILLSFVWYAVQAWIGGQCVYVCLQAIWPSIESRIPNHMPASTGMTTAQFTAYIIFSVISLPLIWIRPHKLKPFFWVSVIIELAFMLILLIWALATMGPEGFGGTITQPVTDRVDSIGWVVLYGIISSIGAISAGILNQNDYARFARRPRNVVYGQLVACCFYFVFSATVGILVTAATQNRFGAPLWSLPTLLSAIIESGGPRSRAAAFFAGAALIVSQFGINIPGNALSGGFDLAATFPRFINIRRGAYLTAVLSMVVNPWRLLSTASTFLAVMSAYSVFLGPMIGLMISSYYIVHRQKINVSDLYLGGPASIYWHTAGVNWRAPVAWLCGVAPAMPGFVANVDPSVIMPLPARRVYYVNFLVGFGVAAAVYVLLHTVFPARRQRAFVQGPMSWRDTVGFYRAAWDDASVETVGVGVDAALVKGGVEARAEPVLVKPDKDDAAVMDLPHVV